MQVFHYSMKLSQNEAQVQEKKSGIRTVVLPRDDCYYYSKQNMLVRQDYFGVEFYFIHENQVVRDKELTNSLKSRFMLFYQVFFLENQMVMYRANHVLRLNIETFNVSGIFTWSLPWAWPQMIIKFDQINGKSFIATSKWDHRNLKKSHTLLNKNRIISTQCYKHIVQAFTGGHLYFYNTRMTKQIRKYHRFDQDEPIFNSNYLLVPSFNFNYKRLIVLTIYDIQSMKRKGTLVTTDRNQLKYDSCIFIRDYNVIGVLYKTRLDLYDFKTLKCIDSQDINNQYERELVMRHDEHNGLTIFIKRK